MADFETDLQDLEDGINKVVQPAIEAAGQVRDELKHLEEGERSRIVGGHPGGGVAFRVTCNAFANRYLDAANDLMSNQQKLVGALETLRDTLRDVLESYRKNEVRQEEHFRTILRDI